MAEKQHANASRALATVESKIVANRSALRSTAQKAGTATVLDDDSDAAVNEGLPTDINREVVPTEITAKETGYMNPKGWVSFAKGKAVQIGFSFTESAPATCSEVGIRPILSLGVGRLHSCGDTRRIRLVAYGARLESVLG